MSLNLDKLEKKRSLANGRTQARCPACAENNQDKKGEHLWVHPDGRFGCCVHPNDKEHRRRIFALVGDRSPRTFKVRVSNESPAPTRSICDSLKNFRILRAGETDVDTHSEPMELNFRTPRTVMANPYAYGENDSNYKKTKKDNTQSVPSVLRSEKEERMPFFTAGGILSIPLNSPERFHWWKGGQSIDETIAEVRSVG